MRHFPGLTTLGHKLSQNILKNTYHTKNQNKIKVSENWGEKKITKIVEIKPMDQINQKGNEKILREKGKQKYNISKQGM